MRSPAPAEVPPEITVSSLSRCAKRTASMSFCGSSSTIPRMTGAPPASRTAAAIEGAVAAGAPAGCAHGRRNRVRVDVEDLAGLQPLARGGKLIARQDLRQQRALDCG